MQLLPTIKHQWSSCLQTLEGHSDWVRSVVFSHDGKHLASASGDQTVKIWDATDGTRLQTLEGHSDGVNSVVFSRDSKHLASASGDHTIKIWDATDGACLQTLDVGITVRDISFDKSASFLLTEIGAFELKRQSDPMLEQSTASLQQYRFGFSFDMKWIIGDS